MAASIKESTIKDALEGTYSHTNLALSGTIKYLESNNNSLIMTIDDTTASIVIQFWYDEKPKSFGDNVTIQTNELKEKLSGKKESDITDLEIKLMKLLKTMDALPYTGTFKCEDLVLVTGKLKKEPLNRLVFKCHKFVKITKDKEEYFTEWFRKCKSTQKMIKVAKRDRSRKRARYNN